jgi:DNA repair protein SbcD/Mre11
MAVTPSCHTVSMRLLHTSDWHIGRKFHQLSLLEDQLAFGDWLAELIRSESIDLVLIAGDLYDRASPAADAVDVLDEIFTRITEAGAKIVAISGNHDSGERLNFGSAAMAAAGVHIRAERRDLSSMGSPLTFAVDGHDPIQILPLPYIDPYRITDLGEVPARHSSVLESVINAQSPNLISPERTIAMAHAFVTGGSASDSERELSVGGTSMVPAEIFSPFGYTALGHLHRPQQIASLVGDPSVVYSGSPIPYSFSEEHTKSVRLLEVGAEITSQEIPVDVGRPVHTLTGTLHDLLKDPRWDLATNSFVRARLTDPSVQLGAMEKLRQRFPNILELEQIALTAQNSQSGSAMRQMVRRSPGELLNGYLDQTFPDLDDEDRSLIHASFDRVSGSRA